MLRDAVRDHCTRYAINVRLIYHRVSRREHPGESGWVRDLNMRGAWVELPEFVRPGSALTIGLAAPVGNVLLLSHVVWARPDLPNRPYLHGLRFTGTTRGQRDRLSGLFADHKPLPLRLYCAMAATCERRGVRCPAIPGTTRDLSEEGMCVRLPESVALGTELCVRTATEFGQIVADAQVVWNDATQAGLPGGASYRHGLRFLRLHQSSELPLRALLDGIR